MKGGCFLFHYLIFDLSFSKVLEYDSNEDVEHDLWGNDYKWDPEQSGLQSPYWSVIVIVDYRLDVVYQNEEDHCEGVKESVKVEIGRGAIDWIYKICHLIDFGLIGEELKAEQGVDIYYDSNQANEGT